MELLPNEQLLPCLMESAYLSHSPAYVPFSPQCKAEELGDDFFCYPSYYQQEIIPTAPPSILTENITATAVKPEKDSENKRKQRNVSCLTTAQSKSMGRSIKNGRSGKTQVEEKQPPTDFIHVRARRGQATDSHSLAERVRRERISEKMKILQGLVPGCEKVTGKALVLDEIIKYVESLKNQIEFLSMKLASVSPILSELGFCFDEFTSAPEHVDGNPQLPPSMNQSSDIQSPKDNSTVMASTSNLVFPVQEAAAFSQDDDSFLMQTEELDDQLELYSMYSFQWMGETDESTNYDQKIQCLL